jgi:hypothetical protein
MKKVLKYLVLILIAGFILIQLVPYGRNHTNPPVVSEPNWDSPRTHELAVRACFDCHSNETVWPWYSNIAPASWLVYHDVETGRRFMNFSDWGTRRQESGEIAEVVNGGEMPPSQYLLMHPEARLSASEKQELVQGFSKIGQ